MTAPNTTRPLFLLLLPPPPNPATSSAIQAAYTAPLTAILKSLTFERRRDPTGSILDIALPCPELATTEHKTRTALYDRIQSKVSSLYKLLCVIAAREAINIEDDKGIDVRALLLAYPDPDPEEEQVTGDLVSPVVTIQTLARCERPWSSIASVESEEGENLLRHFITSQDRHLKLRRLPGGTVQHSPQAPDQSDEPPERVTANTHSHFSIALGGTFDHIHAGHKLLLTMFAFLLAENHHNSTFRHLTIGMTGDELLKNKKYPDLLESYDSRQQVVQDFMRGILDFRPPTEDATVKVEVKNEEGANGHAVDTWLGDMTMIHCVELSDPFGPTITDKDITALVVSAETRAGGKAINERRVEKGWEGLEVFEVDVLDAGGGAESGAERESFEAKLSSTSIRRTLSERAEKAKAKV